LTPRTYGFTATTFAICCLLFGCAQHLPNLHGRGAARHRVDNSIVLVGCDAPALHSALNRTERRLPGIEAFRGCPSRSRGTLLRGDPRGGGGQLIVLAALLTRCLRPLLRTLHGQPVGFPP